MGYVVMLEGTELRDILQSVVDQEVPAIMSYLSKGKWHIAKVLLTGLDDENIRIASVRMSGKQQPINIRLGQPIGISFKYEYGKYLFDTVVEDLRPPSDPDSGGTIVAAAPDRLEVVQRRSYFRVNTPESLKVHVLMWHRRHKNRRNGSTDECMTESEDCCQGRLIDISAGGAQVAVERQAFADKHAFKVGQFIGMRFTPLPYETPVLLNAQIRNILPRSDGETVYVGLQIVGLEASIEGREVLTRLVGIVEQYYRMNQVDTGRPQLQHAAESA